MTGDTAVPGAAAVSMRGRSSGAVPAGGIAPFLAALGGVAALLLARPAPAAAGAARLASPDVLLGVLDACVLVTLSWPGRRGTLHATARALVIVAVAAPFHAALAAAAGGGSGHLAATAIAALAFGAAGVLGADGDRRRHMATLVVLALGVPLVAYACTEFVRVEALAALRASPIVLPALLARGAASAVAADALPAVAGAACLVMAARLGRRVAPPSSTAGRALIALVVAAGALGATPPVDQAFADDATVEVLFDGVVRPGLPVTVRVRPPPDRVRAPGSPWVRARGADGDEFVLPGVEIRGDRVVLELDRAGERSHREVRVSVRAAPPSSAFVAHPGGREVDDTRVALSIDSLATAPEAWRLFSAADLSDAPALRDAVRAAAESGVSARLLDPWRALPDVGPFRAAAAAAASAPRLPRDVGIALAFLALAQVALALLLRTRRDAPLVVAACLATPAAAVLVWMLVAGRLPGPLSAAALVVDDGASRVVLVRVEAARDGRGAIRPPDGASAPTLLRIEPGDGSEVGVELGREALLDLPAGASRIIAYSVPGGGTAVPGRAPPAALVAWLAARGLHVTGAAPDAEAGCPDARGLRIVPAGSFVVTPSRK